MIKGIYISASGMDTQIKHQDVISNNLANVDTPGFKRDFLVVDSFSRMLISRLDDPEDRGHPAVLGQLSLGGRPVCTVTDFSSGKFVATGRDLDFAVEKIAEVKKELKI